MEHVVNQGGSSSYRTVKERALLKQRDAERDQELADHVKDKDARDKSLMGEIKKRDAERDQELAGYVKDKDARDRQIAQEARQREEQLAEAVKRRSKLSEPVKATLADKFVGQATTALPELGEAFVVGIEKMLGSSPQIANHIQNLFSGKATLKFDSQVESACFDAQENQVIMPGNQAKAGDPADMVDAFLFESCNVERAADYVELHNGFMNNLDTEPKSFADYGAAKAKIECEATTKQVHLLFDLFDKGGDLALAGKRNLLQTGGLVMAHMASMKQGSLPVTPELLQEFEGFRKQCEALDLAKGETVKPGGKKQHDEKVQELSKKLDASAAVLLDKHKDFLRQGLPLIGTDKDLGQAVLENFMESRHNVNKAETDKGYLCTKDMYAFEQMESLKVQDLTKLAKTALLNAAPRKQTNKEDEWQSIENNWPAIEDWMDKALRQFELNDEEIHARQKVLLDVIEKVEKDFPETKGKFGEAFGFTADMKKVAEARFKLMVEKNPETWENRKDLCPPPTKGWSGKAPIPLNQVNKAIAEADFKPGSWQHQDRDALRKITGSSDGKVAFKAVSNSEAGVNTSFKIKSAAENSPTVALFKPRSAFAGGEKEAQCFKKPGAKEAREVACSAWNEFCGGLGDYPVTVPAEFDGQQGSLMAWRGVGTKEFSDFTPDSIETMLTGQYNQYDQLCKYLKDEAKDGIGQLEGSDGNKFRVSLDGRDGTKKIEDLKNECEKSVKEKTAQKQALVATIADNDAQDLMALHVATLQMDAENSNNVMFTMQDGKMKPFAIDGGLSAPEKVAQADLKAPLWLTWPQADKKWTDEQKKKLNEIDVEAARKKLNEHMGKSPVGALEDESVLRMMASTKCLILAANEGLTPKLTWTFIQGIEQDVFEAKKEAPQGNDKEFLAAFTRIAGERLKKVASGKGFAAGSEKNQTIEREVDRLKRVEQEARQAAQLDKPSGILLKLGEIAKGRGLEGVEGVVAEVRDLLESASEVRDQTLAKLEKAIEESGNGPVHERLAKKPMRDMLASLRKALAG